MNNKVTKYSFIEKTLHNLAFMSWSAMLSLGDIESAIYKKKLSKIKVNKPVFITALPRGGTTILLDLCVESGEFVSHTYRDLPFILVPLFWSKFSKGFKRADIPRERAHGDGLMISLDSPEAFEEIIWKGFWPSRYQKDHILPWKHPDYPGFEKFIKDNFRKIIYLRGKTKKSTTRYISKNNLNIARINYLNKIFPESIIIVPFRDPLQHAASLLKQHQNFSRIHKEDKFARKYMKDIGHFDFGKNLKPVDFDRWYTSVKDQDPNNLEFWLQYWINSYSYILKSSQQNVVFFSFDQFCQNPEKGLKKLSGVLEMSNSDLLVKTAKRVRVPKRHQIDIKQLDSGLLVQANKLYAKLQSF